MLSLNGVNVLSQNGDNNATSTYSNYYNSNFLGNINNVLLNQNESITNNVLPSFGALSLDSSNVRTLNQRVVVFNGESLDSLIEILENIYSRSKKIAAYKKVTYNSGDIIVVGFYQKSKVNIIVNQILSIYCNRNSSILRVEYLYDERLAVKLNSVFEFEVPQEIYADIYFLIISNNASIDEKSTISQFAAQFGPIETFQIVCSFPWIYHCRYDSILSAFEAKKFSQVNIEGLQFITKPTIIEIVQLFKKEETQNIWNYVKLFNPQLLGNEQWKKFDILKNKRLATSLSLKNVPKENQINIEDINNGFDIRTTIMIRNIPNQMTYNELKTIIDKSCQKCYNFLYLRFDFESLLNVGYAFINFTNPKDIICLYQDIVGKRWGFQYSKKVCEIAYAKVQGFMNLVKKFQSSKVMNCDAEFRPRLFYTDGPLRGEEFEFSQIRLP